MAPMEAPMGGAPAGAPMDPAMMGAAPVPMGGAPAGMAPEMGAASVGAMDPSMMGAPVGPGPDPVGAPGAPGAGGAWMADPMFMDFLMQSGFQIDQMGNVIDPNGQPMDPALMEQLYA